MSWKSFSQNWQTILFEIPRHEKQTRRVVITKWLAFTTIIVHTVNSLFVPAVFISLFIYLGYSGGQKGYNDFVSKITNKVVLSFLATTVQFEWIVPKWFHKKVDLICQNYKIELQTLTEKTP